MEKELANEISEMVRNETTFEFNDVKTRNNVINNVKNILSDFEIDDYIVVCDETINTPETIDNNELKVITYFKIDPENFTIMTHTNSPTGVDCVIRKGKSPKGN